MLHMKVYQPLTAVALALLVAVLAVRALGQTDLVSRRLAEQASVHPKEEHHAPHTCSGL